MRWSVSFLGNRWMLFCRDIVSRRERELQFHFVELYLAILGLCLNPTASAVITTIIYIYIFFKQNKKEKKHFPTR